MFDKGQKQSSTLSCDSSYLKMFTELCTEKHGWYRCNYYDNLKLSKSDVKDSVERVDARTISLEEFVERYEKPFKPVVITHLQDDWLAQQKWTPEVMFRDTFFLHTRQKLPHFLPG